jgi:hypothetical protein
LQSSAKTTTTLFLMSLGYLKKLWIFIINIHIPSSLKATMPTSPVIYKISNRTDRACSPIQVNQFVFDINTRTQRCHTAGVFDHVQHGEHRGLGAAGTEFPRTDRMAKIMNSDFKGLKDWIDKNPGTQFFHSFTYQWMLRISSDVGE